MGLSDQYFEELLAAMTRMSTAQRLKLKRALELAATSAADADGVSPQAAPGEAKFYPEQGTGILPPPKPRGGLTAALEKLPEFTDEEVDRMEAAIAASKASWER